jgi:spore germination cell wall hydrolase CwlJ-like protein
MISAAVICLALNIYHEARGESLTGQIAVAQVTLNRSRDPAYPDEIYEVVYQDHQFSWTSQEPPEKELASLALAIWIARKTLVGSLPDPTDGATHFYSGTKTPYWAPSMEVTNRIGGHTFLKDTRS